MTDVDRQLQYLDAFNGDLVRMFETMDVERWDFVTLALKLGVKHGYIKGITRPPTHRPQKSDLAHAIDWLKVRAYLQKHPGHRLAQAFGVGRSKPGVSKNTYYTADKTQLIVRILKSAEAEGRLDPSAMLRILQEK